jgi:hypothetical protein
VCCVRSGAIVSLLTPQINKQLNQSQTIPDSKEGVVKQLKAKGVAFEHHDKIIKASN